MMTMMIILVLMLIMRIALTVALVTKLEQVEEMRSLIVTSRAASTVRVHVDHARGEARIAKALSRRSRCSWRKPRRCHGRRVVCIVHSGRISTGLIAIERLATAATLMIVVERLDIGSWGVRTRLTTKLIKQGVEVVLCVARAITALAIAANTEVRHGYSTGSNQLSEQSDSRIPPDNLAIGERTVPI
jgi:hypothetical protein